MLTRLDSDVWELECDTCGNVETLFGDFSDVLQQVRDLEWKSYRESSGWENLCPTCQINPNEA